MRNRFCRATLAFSVILAALVSHPVRADEAQEITKLTKQGQYGKALEQADAFLSTHPRDPQVRFLKGVILTEQKRLNEAISVFVKLTEEYPDLPEPYNNLAVLFAAQGQYDKARVALENAIRTHPSYATAHENLGDIYTKLASLAYDKALQLDSGNVAAQTKLALIREMIGGQPRTGATKTARAEVPSQSEPERAATRPERALPRPTPAESRPPLDPKAEARGEVRIPGEVKPAEPRAEKSSSPKGRVETATKPNVEPGADAVRSLQGWAHAWSQRDVDAYLKFYAHDFRPPNGESRRDWEKSRRLRILAPKHISVSLEGVRASPGENGTISIRFRQTYKAGGNSMAARKTVVMTKSGDSWLIQQERVDR